MPDLPDYAQSVSIDAANVTIPISGSVSIAAGSVTIANASIAVINATGTKITSARPPTDLLATAAAPSTTVTTTTATLPADIQALVVVLPNDLSRYVHLKIEWTPSGSQLSWVPLELFHFSQQVYVIPLAPFTRDGSTGVVSTLNVTVQASGTGSAAVELLALYESNPLWLEFFAPAFAEPNQLPLVAGIDLGGVALVQFASQWLINPLANVQIALFEIIQGFVQQGIAPMAYLLGHGAALPSGVALAPLASRLAVGSSAAAIGNEFLFEFHGAELPRGEGVWLQNPQPANLQVALFTLNYSLG